MLEAKFSIIIGHTLKKHILKSRTVFTQYISGGSTINILRVNVLILLRECCHELLVGFWERKWNKSFILASKNLGSFCLMSHSPLTVVVYLPYLTYSSTKIIKIKPKQKTHPIDQYFRQITH